VERINLPWSLRNRGMGLYPEEKNEEQWGGKVWETKKKKHNFGVGHLLAIGNRMSKGKGKGAESAKREEKEIGERTFYSKRSLET